jgi:hypothetical protein
MDRDAKVKDSAKKLIVTWLALLNNNVQKLLSLTNPLEKENISQQVGVTVMEYLLLPNDNSAPYSSLYTIVKEKFPKWNANISSINPSEILWVYMRCAFAKQYCSATVADEICECLLPDAVAICRLISSAISSGELETNLKRQFVVKYLIELSAWTDASNVSGRSQLQNLFMDMLANVNVPLELVNVIMTAYTLVFDEEPQQSSAYVNLLTVAVKLSEERLHDDDDDEEDKEELLGVERALHLIRWVLQRGGSNKALWETSFEPLVPMILRSLQQPVAELRLLAVDCLGLLCIVGRTCTDDYNACRQYRQILVQVAVGDFEEDDIRSEAVKCLTDISLTSAGQFTDSDDLCTVLLRMQESGEPIIAIAAAECAAKLLFAGEMTEPRLFANLLKFFFLSELMPTDLENNSGVGDDTTSEKDFKKDADVSANPVRLQQFLSIFFQSFIALTSTVAGSTSSAVTKVILGAIAPVVASVTLEIKTETVDVSSLNKVLVFMPSSSFCFLAAIPARAFLTLFCLCCLHLDDETLAVDV